VRVLSLCDDPNEEANASLSGCYESEHHGSDARVRVMTVHANSIS
jgi:hypothetical protein